MSQLAVVAACGCPTELLHADTPPRAGTRTHMHARSTRSGYMQTQTHTCSCYMQAHRPHAVCLLASPILQVTQRLLAQTEYALCQVPMP